MNILKCYYCRMRRWTWSITRRNFKFLTNDFWENRLWQTDSYKDSVIPFVTQTSKTIGIGQRLIYTPEIFYPTSAIPCIWYYSLNHFHCKNSFAWIHSSAEDLIHSYEHFKFIENTGITECFEYRLANCQSSLNLWQMR